MRHRYDTRGIVLARFPLGETSAAVTLVTEELGLIKARAQGMRVSGAKLATALSTFTESDIVLMRGNEGWRIAGAVPVQSHFRAMNLAGRRAAARVVGLLLRLADGEEREIDLYGILRSYFETLAQSNPPQIEHAEILGVSYVLRILGFADDLVPASSSYFSPESLSEVATKRSHYIEHINRGIAASGL